MISLRIKQNKVFMNKMLIGNLFSSFLLEEAVIQTYNLFTIDGHIAKEFYGDDEEKNIQYPLSTWDSMQKICLDLIKGHLTPLGFKFVLHLKPEAVDNLLRKHDIALTSNDLSLVLNIRFGEIQTGESVITITSGASIKTFTLDKSYETIWDNAVCKMFDVFQMDYEKLV